MLHEISIFIDNKKGRLKAVTQVLYENGINIRAFNVQDRSDFGLMKMLVSDTEKCEKVLKEAGFACAVKNTAAVIIEDKPGGIFSVFDVLDKAGIDVTDSCAFVTDPGKRAIMCIETADPENTEAVLETAGFPLCIESELSF